MLAPILASPPHHPQLDRCPPFPAKTSGTHFDPFAADDGDAGEWTQEDIVYVHWRMLEEIADLADPRQPLDEKFDTIQWIFSDPDKDDLPFSFANCVRVVGCSPLSPIPYCGFVDVEAVRDHLRFKLKQWLNTSLERYPEWVRLAVMKKPEWIRERLARNPQWINEQLKRIKDEGDLFA